MTGSPAIDAGSNALAVDPTTGLPLTTDQRGRGLPEDRQRHGGHRRLRASVRQSDQTISFAPLANKTYGDAPFTVHATASSGLAPTFTIVSGPATIDPTANLVTITGTGHVVVRASQAGDANYNAAPDVNQGFDVAQATLIVTAADQSRTYGSANLAFTASYSGFVLGQDESVLGGSLTFTTAATPASDVGSYAITPGGLTSTNYAITFVPGTLTVTPAPLSVTPGDKTREYGLDNPTLDGTISATRNSDVFAASYATLATPASDVGTYDITATLAGVIGAKLTNYAVTYNVGHLSITPTALTVTPNDIASKVYGSTVSLTGVITGRGTARASPPPTPAPEPRPPPTSAATPSVWTWSPPMGPPS